MNKTCANGHQMDSSWTICPYCQKTGYRDAGLRSTTLEGAPGSAPGGVVVGGQPTAAAASPVRKTVLLSQKNKPPVVGWFVALDGEHKGEDFRLRDGQNVIGTEPGCDVVLRDSTISSRHASLRYKDGKFLLTDLDSSNGTYLNEQTETLAREELKDNDTVRLGDVRFKFKCL